MHLQRFASVQSYIDMYVPCVCVRVMRSLKCMQSHSGRQFLSHYFLFWKICQTLPIMVRVFMINKKQLFHEMLGGERVLSLWDRTIPLTLKFLLINRRKWGVEKRRSMLETEGKTPHDSHPNVKNKQANQKTKSIHQLHFFYFTTFYNLPHSWFGPSWLRQPPSPASPKTVRRGEAL